MSRSQSLLWERKKDQSVTKQGLVTREMKGKIILSSLTCLPSRSCTPVLHNSVITKGEKAGSEIHDNKIMESTSVRMTNGFSSRKDDLSGRNEMKTDGRRLEI